MESITVKLKDGYPWRSTSRDRKKQSSPKRIPTLTNAVGKFCVSFIRIFNSESSLEGSRELITQSSDSTEFSKKKGAFLSPSQAIAFGFEKALNWDP